MSLPLECLLFSSSPSLKIYLKAWGEMDGLRDGERKRDGGVCRCPLKGKEHLDSLSCRENSHVSLLPSSLSVSASLSVFLFLVNSFCSCPFIFIHHHPGGSAFLLISEFLNLQLNVHSEKLAK